MRVVLPLCLLALSTALAGCMHDKRAQYLTGPPVSLSGEPLVDDPSADCRTAVAAWFQRADRNRDGHLDLTEAKADAARFFAEVDSNGDSYLTAYELQAYRERVYPKQFRGALSSPLPPPLKEDKNPLPESEEGAPSAKASAAKGPVDPAQRDYALRPMVLDPVMAADVDLDFRTSKDELAEKVTERGAKLDADGNGFIDAGEMAHFCGGKTLQ